MRTVEYAEMPVLQEPRPRLWTKEEYIRMHELEIIKPEERVELIEGEIISMTSDPKHDDGIAHTTTLLVPAFAPTHIVRVQLTLDAGAISMPEPDLMFLPRDKEKRGAWPEIADLVIEVSHTSLAYDRNKKASLYARSKIPEFWILNVVDRQLEVHRDPHRSRGAFVGHIYRSVRVFKENEKCSALVLPGVEFLVADML